MQRETNEMGRMERSRGRIDKGNEKQATETCTCHIITCYYVTTVPYQCQMVSLLG